MRKCPEISKKRLRDNSTFSGSVTKSFINTSTVTAGKVPAPTPPPDLFSSKEYETKLSEVEVKRIVKGIRILLMTATQNELSAVLGYLKPLDCRDKVIEIFINGTWIYVGKYGNFSVVVGRSAYAKSQQGPLEAAEVTKKIMEIYKPKYIVAIGVCFGMDRNKVKLGDVIVSDLIVDLSTFKEEEGRIIPRGPQPPAGKTLSPFFGNTSGFEMKHSDEENAEKVEVHCGPILTSSALVNDDDFKKQLGKVRYDALAGEMEGAAIFSAARGAKPIAEAIVIKAIGDWGDGKKEACKSWKDFASYAAARYVHYCLDNVSSDALK
uniref:Nucleoside phosphorylase domain-containing protein n=1 Tax=Amphimedon queenslandica TaxID=400682 RepID=A0A1X7THF9_AMPQE